MNGNVCIHHLHNIHTYLYDVTNLRNLLLITYGEHSTNCEMKLQVPKKHVKPWVRKYITFNQIGITQKLLHLSAGPMRARWGTSKKKKVNVYLSFLMMKVPDHVYVLG
jgi:hypothetical protein